MNVSSETSDEEFDTLETAAKEELARLHAALKRKPVDRVLMVDEQRAQFRLYEVRYHRRMAQRERVRIETERIRDEWRRNQRYGR